jgi:tetratricopeptide (TPR) repeat protein
LLVRTLLIILILDISSFLCAQQITYERFGGSYAEIINNADKQLISGNYINALKDYERAWDLNPRQVYPEKKIDQIIKLFADPELRIRLYDDAIRLGDSAFQKKDYRMANNEFFMALRLDPEAIYPKTQMTEISSVFNDPENEFRYRVLIIHAAKKTEKGHYKKALEFYNQALILQPSQDWIRIRISEINKLQDQSLSEMDPYNRLLFDSESLIEQLRFEEARKCIEQACRLKPQERFPIARIAFLDHLLNQDTGEQPTYTFLMQEGEKFVDVMDYENAAILFSRAMILFPDEKQPKKMLAKLKNIQLKENSIVTSYAKAVLNSEILSVTGNWESALIGFQRCQELDPADEYVNSRVNELSGLLKSMKERHRSYLSAVAEGDRLLNNADYTKALSQYRYACKLEPSESYPRIKIKEIMDKRNPLKEAPADNISCNNEIPKISRVHFMRSDSFPGPDPPPDDTDITVNEDISVINAKETINEPSRLINREENKPDIDLNNDLPIKEKSNPSINANSLLPKENTLTTIVAAPKLQPVEPAHKPTFQVQSASLYSSEKQNDIVIQTVTTSTDTKSEQHFVMNPGQSEGMSQAAFNVSTVSTFTVHNNSEVKLNFNPPDISIRKDLVILVRARSTGSGNAKLYVCYGSKDSKNGGIVLKNISRNLFCDYAFQLEDQDKWSREDNSWLSFYSENGQVEIESVSMKPRGY